MSFSVAISGLPNAGKSTLFKILTKKQVDIANYPFTTIEPNIGVVAVPDPKLEKIAEVIRPKKTTPTIIEFVDIAGLVRGASRGEGMGNQFLSHIKGCNAIIGIIRGFKNEEVPHTEREINPERDIKILNQEFLEKDIELAKKIIEKIRKEGKKSNVFEKIKEFLLKNQPIREINLSQEEKDEIKKFQFLTEKPIIYLLNKNEDKKEKTISALKEEIITMDLKLEEELSELDEKEKKELGIFSNIDQLINACYNILNLISFYTIKGGKEAKAWTLKKNSTVIAAAEKVHSDFKEKFIKAEIINWKDLIELKSWNKAKEAGKIKIAGKENIVQNGDVIEFKIS